MIKGKLCSVRSFESKDFPAIENIRRERVAKSPFLGFVTSHPFLELSQIVKRIKPKSYVVEALDGTVSAIIVTDFENDEDKRIALYFDIFEQGIQKTAVEGFRLMIRFLINEMNFNKIYTHILDDQSQIEKVFVEAGFKKEAVLKEHHYSGGSYHDVYMYGLLKEELTND